MKKSKDVVFEDENYIDRKMIKKMPAGKVIKTYIVTIDLEDALSIDSEQFATVEVSFFKKNDWWKSGWLIEGFILEPVYPGDEEPEKHFTLAKNSVEKNDKTSINSDVPPGVWTYQENP